MAAELKTNILVLGVYPETEGYPNIKYRLEALHDCADFSVETLHVPIWQKNIPNKSILSLVLSSFRFVYAHFLLIFRYLRHAPIERVYVPYPAVFVSFLLGLLPERLRPKRLILDAFISLYDTVCMDRQFVSPSHLLAKLLFRIERRAYQNASVVVVDSEQNAEFFSRLFNLPSSKFIAVPLNTYEPVGSIPAYNPIQPKEKYQVVFIGTLIPLHGIEVILGAMALLNDRTELTFKLIGNGQQADLVQVFINKFPDRLEWIKDWQSQAQLIEAITEADLCLGIFGNTAKMQRVCPLKIYSYSLCGRAVITAETDWMRAKFRNEKDAPFKLITQHSAAQLAEAIMQLVANPEQIKRYAEASKLFYLKTLSNEQAMAQFRVILQGI